MFRNLIDTTDYQADINLDSVNIALGNTLDKKEFNKKREQIRSILFSKLNTGEVFWYNSQPTRDYRSRRRYRLEDNQLLFNNMAIDWNTGFSLAYRCLQESVKDKWLGELDYFGIRTITDERFLRDYLSKISELYFSSGRHINYWKFFVGLELLGDYHITSNDIIVDDVGAWFLEGDTYITKTTLKEEDRYNQFSFHSEKIISKLKLNKSSETVKDFFDNRKMDLGKGGATTFLYDKDLKKNKWNTALHLNYKEFKNMIKNYDYNTSKVFIKREGKKPRLVVNETQDLIL